MRQLRTEGWIHNIARRAVASFLTRGCLWVNWEEGFKVSMRLGFPVPWNQTAKADMLLLMLLVGRYWIPNFKQTFRKANICKGFAWLSKDKKFSVIFSFFGALKEHLSEIFVWTHQKDM